MVIRCGHRASHRVQNGLDAKGGGGGVEAAKADGPSRSVLLCSPKKPSPKTPTPRQTELSRKQPRGVKWPSHGATMVVVYYSKYSKMGRNPFRSPIHPWAWSVSTLPDAYIVQLGGGHGQDWRVWEEEEGRGGTGARRHGGEGRSESSTEKLGEGGEGRGQALACCTWRCCLI